MHYDIKEYFYAAASIQSAQSSASVCLFSLSEQLRRLGPPRIFLSVSLLFRVFQQARRSGRVGSNSSGRERERGHARGRHGSRRCLPLVDGR